MAVLSAANAFQCSTTKNNESFRVQNPLFHVAFSVSCSHLLLNRRRYLQNRFFSSPFGLRRRLAPPFPSRPGLGLGLCLAAKPGRPPPPPQSDPPPEPPRLSGPADSFYKLKDRIQIFFAVLFWMSLFFWTSAWDDRNRPNKGSRFRR